MYTLIIMFILTSYGDYDHGSRAITSQTISGFVTKQLCENAGEEINKDVHQIRRLHMSKGKGSTSYPEVRFSCTVAGR